MQVHLRYQLWSGLELTCYLDRWAEKKRNRYHFRFFLAKLVKTFLTTKANVGSKNVICISVLGSKYDMLSYIYLNGLYKEANLWVTLSSWVGIENKEHQSKKTCFSFSWLKENLVSYCPNPWTLNLSIWAREGSKLGMFSLNGLQNWASCLDHDLSFSKLRGYVWLGLAWVLTS